MPNHLRDVQGATNRGILFSEGQTVFPCFPDKEFLNEFVVLNGLLTTIFSCTVRKTLLIFPQDDRFYYVCVLKNREFVE